MKQTNKSKRDLQKEYFKLNEEVNKAKKDITIHYTKTIREMVVKGQMVD
jgi:uncharacterized FlaG/YvyC family protein